MDVGATVGNIAFYTAFFACLSYIALSVELGHGPTGSKQKRSLKNFFKKSDKQNKPKNSNATDRTEQTLIEIQSNDKTLDTTHAALTDGVARSELDEKNAFGNLDNLRSKFIDGFLGPRIKYDVALTTLYESQNNKVLKPDDGLEVASKAFLEATQSIEFTED